MQKPSKVVLATDHAGFTLKEHIKKYLGKQHIDTVDVGTFSEEPVDYPAIIRKGCAAALENGCPAFIFGGSGNGEAMAANKVKGIRAAVGWSEESAKLARLHNNANVLSIGGRLIEETLAEHMVDIFLSTEFEGGRHSARVEDLE